MKFIEATQLRVTLGIAFIVGLAMSPKAWLSERDFPHTPVFDWLPTIPTPLDMCLFVGILGLLFVMLLMPKPKIVLMSAAIGIGGLMLFDQNRWQPWAYQYLVMMIGLSYLYFQKSRDKKKAALNALRILIASIYLWSGLQKVNYLFFDQVFPWLVQPVLGDWSTSTPVKLMGGLVPFFEASLGIALLTVRFRRMAIWAVLGMHAVLLGLLGPVGHNWNSIVWPWNVAMCLFVYILFRHYKGSFQETVVSQYAIHRIAILLFALLPSLSFVGLWDSYLSFSLYSGNTQQAFVVQNGKRLNLSEWAIAELNVPAYPERRVYDDIWKKLCRRMKGNSNSVTFVVEGKPNVLTGARSLVRDHLTCSPDLVEPGTTPTIIAE